MEEKKTPSRGEIYKKYAEKSKEASIKQQQAKNTKKCEEKTK